MPKRVKVIGDLYHGRIPEGAVYVGRATPGLRESKFCNPYPVKRYGREMALTLFRHYATELAVHELEGKDLACWCKPDEDCHADILLRLANEELER